LGSIDDFPYRFAQGLALLTGDDHTEVFLVLKHQLAPLPKELAPILRKHIPPALPRAVSRLDGLMNIPLAGICYFSNPRSRSRIINGNAPTILRNTPLTIDV